MRGTLRDAAAAASTRGADQRPRDSARLTMRGVRKINSSLRRSLCAAALEEHAEDRDVAEQRDLVEVATGVAGVDAADDRGVAVHDEQVGLGLALEDRRVAAAPRSG